MNTPLTSLTKDQLISGASKVNIHLPSSLLKKEMIERLNVAGYLSTEDLQNATLTSSLDKNKTGSIVDSKDDKIVKNLSIRVPENTNPIPFINTVGMDDDLSDLLREKLAQRHLNVGLPAEAKELEEDILSGVYELEAEERAKDHLLKLWDVHDPHGTAITSNWSINLQDRILKQDRNTGSGNRGQSGSGAIITCKQKIEKGVTKITAKVNTGTGHETGLIYNFIDDQNFTMVKYRNHPGAAKEENKHLLSLIERKDGKDQKVGGISCPDLTNQSLVFVVSEIRVMVRKLIPNRSKSKNFTVHTFPNAKHKIREATQVGLYSRYNEEFQCRNLSLHYGLNRKMLVPVPTASNTREYEKRFTIDTVDMRPATWVHTIQKLRADIIFAKNRYKQAKAMYDNAELEMADYEENYDGLSIADIEEIEDHYQFAFEELTLANRALDEFRGFLAGQGITYQTNKDTDSDLLKKIDIEFTQKLQRIKVNTWKEFTIKYRQQLPDGINGHITSEKVSHEQYISTPLKSHVENEREGAPDKLVEGKYWSSAFETFTDEKTMTIKDPRNIYVRLQKIINRLTIDGEKEADQPDTNRDIREYRAVSGQYIDQYGFKLEEHVIDITENPDPEKDYILLIPFTDSINDENEPEKMLIIKNPVFSGKQLHAPVFLFHEHYNMDLSWNGIGLGEFSHSVNLFPGEERQIQMVSTKKRSFKTVSTTTQMSSSTSGSVSTSGSKSTDSFSENLSESLESSESFSTKQKKSSKTSVSAEVSASNGFVSASVSASHSSRKSSTSTSSTSSVAKNANETAKNSSKEVSQNNKVSFSSSTKTSSSTSKTMAGKDRTSETSTITVSNINEGRTVNYNFFQVTNIYSTLLRVEDVKVEISTGIEIIPGTGITITKAYDLADFGRIINDFKIYDYKDRKEIMKAVAAQVLRRYINIPGDVVDDDPQVLCPTGDVDITKLKKLREMCTDILTDPEKPLEDQTFPETLFDMRKVRFRVNSFEVDELKSYTVNSGKYYVDAQLGKIPATEEYLEKSRELELERDQAAIEQTRAKTRLGMFHDYPEGLTSLTIEQNDGNVRVHEKKEEDLF